MDKLTPEQWKDKTINDLYKRQKEREKGIKAADDFLAENRVKGHIDKSKIRAKCYK